MLPRPPTVLLPYFDIKKRQEANATSPPSGTHIAAAVTPPLYTHIAPLPDLVSWAKCATPQPKITPTASPTV